MPDDANGPRRPVPSPPARLRAADGEDVDGDGPVGAGEQSAFDAPVAIPGQVVAGTYKLLGVLGAGGMGQVFLAEHLRTGGEVALKVIGAARLGNERAVRRFELEARHTARLSHPNIVRVFDFGSDDGVVYIAMERVRGTSVDALLQRGPLGVGETLEIVQQVLLGLEVAHEAGVIHRDIKPGNIMTSGAGAERLVTILDFGIARALEGPGVDTQGAIGSPQFMAPEQFNHGSQVTAASDLYSLGCTIYAMLTGLPPFEAPFWSLAYLHNMEAPPRLDAVPALADWVERLLQKSPADRPGSAREALASLLTIDLGVVSAAVQSRPMSDLAATHSTPATQPGLPAPATTLDPAPAQGFGADVARRAGPSASASAETPAESGSTPGAPRWLLPALGGVALPLLAWFGWVMFGPAAPSVDPATPVMPSVLPPPDPVLVASERLNLPIVDSLATWYKWRLDPSGTRLLVLRNGVLEIRPRNGGAGRRVPLPKGPQYVDAEWFPDGQSVLVGQRLDGAESLWRVGVDEPEYTELAAGSARGKVSPDGRSLAYVAGGDLVVATLDGVERWRVAVGAESWAAGFSWLSDGSGLVYANVASGWVGNLRFAGPGRSVLLHQGLPLNTMQNHYVFTTTLDRGVLYRDGNKLMYARLGEDLSLHDRRPVADSGEDWTFSSLSSAGRDAPVVTFCQQQVDAGVELLPLRGTEVDLDGLETVSGSSRAERVHGWSVDDRLLLVTSREGGSTRVQEQPVDGTTGRTTLLTTTESVGAPTYGPDGRSVVFLTTSAEGATTVTVLRDGSRHEAPLVRDRPAQAVIGRSHRCASGPKAGCVLHETTKDHHIFTRFDPETGSATPVVTLPVEPGVEAADVRPWDLRATPPQIALIDTSPADHIKFISLEGEVDRRALTGDQSSAHYLGFGPAGELYMAGPRTGVAFVLSHVDVRGAVTQMYTSQDLIALPVPSRDGSRLVWGRVKVSCTPQWMSLPAPP